MNDNYKYMKQIQIEKNISLKEVFDIIGKQRLNIFIIENVNELYNETIVKTSNHAEIQYFRFIAVIDARTSVICRTLNQTVLSKYQSYFFPPLHPHCRSHIEPIKNKFNENQLFDGKLKANDVRRVSWYKSTYACNFDTLNIENILTTYL